MVFEFANECKDAVADVRSDTSDTNWAVRHSPRAGGRARVPACSLPPGTQPPRGNSTARAASAVPWRHSTISRWGARCGGCSFARTNVDTPRPSPRTNRTRRAPHPVLIGHATCARCEGCSFARTNGGRVHSIVLRRGLMARAALLQAFMYEGKNKLVLRAKVPPVLSGHAATKWTRPVGRALLFPLPLPLL